MIPVATCSSRRIHLPLVFQSGTDSSLVLAPGSEGGGSEEGREGGRGGEEGGREGGRERKRGRRGRGREREGGVMYVLHCNTVQYNIQYRANPVNLDSCYVQWVTGIVIATVASTHSQHSSPTDLQ